MPFLYATLLNTFIFTLHQKHKIVTMNSVIQTLQNNLPTLKAKYPLLSLGIFGSYSRGEETPNSDLDVLYEALPNTFLDLDNYFALKQDLAAITQIKIDLVNKKYINPVVWLKAKNDVIYV
jgi:predicted nucleotidyltransferase